MSITGPGSITAASVQAANNMFNQLNTLSTQLATGQAATTYSGLGSQAGVALALNAQLATIGGYSSTATTVGTVMTVAQSFMTQLGGSGTAIEQAIGQQSAFNLNNSGQTTTQAAATTRSAISCRCSIPRSAATIFSRQRHGPALGGQHVGHPQWQRQSNRLHPGDGAAPEPIRARTGLAAWLFRRRAHRP